MALEKMTVGNMSRMAVDDANGRLYWDGKEVVTTMTLPWWVQLAAIVAAASTAVMAVTSVVQLFN